VNKDQTSSLINYDLQLISKFFNLKKKQKIYLIGVDEVGRGSIAGPVTTSAVYYQDLLNPQIISRDLQILNQIHDSKKITKNKRKKLVSFIEKKMFYSLSSIDSKKIDQLGILKATLLSMRNSVFILFSKLISELDLSVRTLFLILVDGNCLIEHLEKDLLETLSQEQKAKIKIHQIARKKADELSLTVASASNLAKTNRDLILEDLSSQFPGYLLSKHKGYGTKEHFEKIKQLGISAVHRMSFLEKFILAKKTKQTKLFKN